MSRFSPHWLIRQFGQRIRSGKYPESNINYYLYGRQIGHGAFGQVNLALHIASGRLVAIKIFAKKNLKNTRAKEKIMTEIEIIFS